MCGIVVINRGEKELTTPRQFIEHFGFNIELEEYLTIELDYCLCQINVEKLLSDNNIEFKQSCGDYYVGNLDNFIED